MNKLCNNRQVRLIGIACSFLLLSACAASMSKESRVEERATARWEALLSEDLAGAYEYLSPGYRSSVSSLQYQRAILIKPVKWTSAKLKEVQCEETTCTVKLAIGFTVYGALPGVRSYAGTSDVDESWVLVSGNWYLVPKE